MKELYKNRKNPDRKLTSRILDSPGKFSDSDLDRWMRVRHVTSYCCTPLHSFRFIGDSVLWFECSCICKKEFGDVWRDRDSRVYRNWWSPLHAQTWWEYLIFLADLQSDPNPAKESGAESSPQSEESHIVSQLDQHIHWSHWSTTM